MAKKAAAVKKPLTKSQLFANISEATGVAKKDVSAVFDALNAEIATAVSKRGPRVFTVPGLCKITVTHKPATKARKGINPFTKEETMFKAKPARDQIKVRPLKGLKDMV